MHDASLGDEPGRRRLRTSDGIGDTRRPCSPILDTGPHAIPGGLAEWTPGALQGLAWSTGSRAAGCRSRDHRDRSAGGSVPDADATQLRRGTIPLAARIGAGLGPLARLEWDDGDISCAACRPCGSSRGDACDQRSRRSLNRMTDAWPRSLRRKVGERVVSRSALAREEMLTRHALRSRATSYQWATLRRSCCRRRKSRAIPLAGGDCAGRPCARHARFLVAFRRLAGGARQDQSPARSDERN